MRKTEKPDGDITDRVQGVHWIQLAQLVVTRSGLEKVCCRLRSSPGYERVGCGVQRWNVVAQVGHFR